MSICAITQYRLPYYFGKLACDLNGYSSDKVIITLFIVLLEYTQRRCRQLNSDYCVVVSLALQYSALASSFGRPRQPHSKMCISILAAVSLPPSPAFVNQSAPA